MPPRPAPSARRVPAETVRPLRTAVLRPSWGPGRLATYPEDDDAGTVHVAATVGDAVGGVGTVYAEAPPGAHRGEIPAAAYAPGAAWRLRGMATSDAARGTGLGRAVLEACYAAARDGGGRFLWCNARLAAVPFYERLGMRAVGPEFDIPEIGPHYVMWADLGGAGPGGAASGGR